MIPASAAGILPARDRCRPWQVAGWALLAAAMANILMFAITAANPLVSSDAWYFLEAFVPRALDGTIGIGDLYAKRGGFDHAQPLNKLFLLLNARYLDLDFTYEAIVGVLAGAAGVLVLKRIVDLEPATRRGASYWLPLSALGAVYLSLNSSMVVTWPLVAFGYVTLLVVLLSVLSAWKAWNGGSVLVFAFAMLACAATADDSAVLLAGAVAATFLWTGHRSGNTWRGARLALVALGAVGLYLAIYAFFDQTAQAEQRGVADTLTRLLHELSAPGGGRVLAVLASGLAFYGQLEAYFGASWPSVQIGLGLFMLAAHIAYWWRALASKPGPAAFASIALMLLAYGYIAGVLYARVPDAGLGYVNEPRYAVLYQMQIVALLLLMLASPRAESRGRPVVVTVAVVLLALQVPLSLHTWEEARFDRSYWRQMAGQMVLLSRDPSTTPEACVPILVVCEWDVARRQAVFSLLQRYQLNLFSADFRRRHGFVDN